MPGVEIVSQLIPDHTNTNYSARMFLSNWLLYLKTKVLNEPNCSH